LIYASKKPSPAISRQAAPTAEDKVKVRLTHGVSICSGVAIQAAFRICEGRRIFFVVRALDDCFIKRSTFRMFVGRNCEGKLFEKNFPSSSLSKTLYQLLAVFVAVVFSEGK
jgi:hypothetical protein